MTILKNQKYLISLAVILSTLFIAGCASKKEEITRDIVEKELYDQAQRRMKAGNYISAVLSLETLEKRFPFGKYAEQAQAELIFAYYKSANYEGPISAADRFISLHPRHPNIDYAYYIKGLSKFNNDKALFASLPLLGEMTHKRELSAAKESFQDLGDFIDRFPESEYAGNAKQRMIYLRNLIAKQEIYVAEFYIERKAYIAALGRADYVIKHMSRTPSVERALEIMVLVYEELDQNDLKIDAQEALLEYKNKRS